MAYMSVGYYRLCIIGWTLIGAVFCGMLSSVLFFCFARPKAFSVILEPVLQISVWGGLAGCLLAAAFIIGIETGEFIKK